MDDWRIQTTTARPRVLLEKLLPVKVMKCRKKPSHPGLTHIVLPKQNWWHTLVTNHTFMSHMTHPPPLITPVLGMNTHTWPNTTQLQIIWADKNQNKHEISIQAFQHSCLPFFFPQQESCGYRPVWSWYISSDNEEENLPPVRYYATRGCETTTAAQACISSMMSAPR